MYSSSGFPSYLLTQGPLQSSAVVDKCDEFSSIVRPAGERASAAFYCFTTRYDKFPFLHSGQVRLVTPLSSPGHPRGCRFAPVVAINSGRFIKAELLTPSPERSDTGPTSFARLAITVAWQSRGRRAGPQSERSQVQLFLMELNDSLLSVGLRASGRCRFSQLQMLIHISAF